MLYSGKVVNAKSGVPICGVPVSDGRNTVLTDKEGCYNLPGWESCHTVWVGMLTCGHSDWYHFTDGKAGTYDFAVTPWESEKLDLLHISDTEISADKDVEWVDFLAEKAKALKPALVMHTGDITRRDGILLHTPVMNFETMGCPVRYVMGNHDYAVATDPTAHYGEQPYEEEAGPVWNSFDCGGIHCVVLAIGKGSRGDMPSGYTREDQWEWLRRDLEIAGKGKPLVVFEHGPGPDPDNFIMGDMDLKTYGLMAWIYGHAHTNYYHIVNGVHTICTGRAHTGGIDSSPAGIRHITLSKDAVTSKMYYRRFPVAKADKAVWQTTLEGNVLFSEPVLAGEDLLVGTINDDKPNTAGLYCLDANSGTVKWFVPVEGNGIPNSYAVEGDKVYCEDSAGNIYCLDKVTGKQIWCAGAAEKSRTRMAVVLSGDKVLCGNPMHPMALDKETGKMIWRFEEPIKKAGRTPARTIVDEAHGYTFICGQWGIVLCVKTATGEEVWRRAEKPLWYRNGTPCVDGEFIYAGGFDMLLKMNIHTGETVAECNVGEAARAMGAPIVETDGDMNVCGGFAVDGDILYCPTAGSGVVAVDKNEMKVLRRYPAGAAAILTAPYVKQGAQMVESCPVIAGDTLIFTAMDGKVYFYDKLTGELLRTINMSAASLVKPIVTEDAVYVADFDGNVCKFTIAK